MTPRAVLGGLSPLRVRVPGDKSISHRAALLAGMATGTSRIAGFSQAGDCQATLQVLHNLGVSIALDDDVLTVEGGGSAGLRSFHAAFDCSRSGTTMRLAAGLLAGLPFTSRLTGDRQLLARPMGRIAEPLRAMGAAVKLSAGDTAPLRVLGGDLHGITYQLPVASAQVKSAILLAGIQAEGTTTVVESMRSRDHTERLLSAMGASLQSTPPKLDSMVTTHHEVSVVASDLRPIDLAVPGDLSSAAPLMAAALLSGRELIVHEVGLNATRCGFLRALERMGAVFEVEVHGEVPEPSGDLRVVPGPLGATEVGPEEVPSLVDELPLLAVVATQAEGSTLITGAGELRAKESDRIAGLVAGLQVLGADVDELPDGVVVTGPTPLHSAVCDARGDHRLAMAFSVGALMAQGHVRIEGLDFVDDSFPGFVSALKALR